METERTELNAKLADGQKLFTDLQSQHTTLSDLLATEKHALEDVIQAERAKCAEQKV